MTYEYAFLQALSFTITLECFAAACLKKYFGQRLSLEETTYPRLLVNVALASALTLPYMWFIYPGFVSYGLTYVITAEILVILAEAIFYCFSLKTSLRTAFVLSLTANMFSYFIGNIVF